MVTSCWSRLCGLSTEKLLARSGDVLEGTPPAFIVALAALAPWNFRLLPTASRTLPCVAKLLLVTVTYTCVAVHPFCRWGLSYVGTFPDVSVPAPPGGGPWGGDPMDTGPAWTDDAY